MLFNETAKALMEIEQIKGGRVDAGFRAFGFYLFPALRHGHPGNNYWQIGATIADPAAGYH